jgi:uncharacterized repeat protein (TIGR01451 family)
VVLYLSLRDSLQIDLGHDGNLSPGDTLRYTLLVTNTSDRPATSAVITTAIDPHLQLVVGSVTTNAGSVATGNSSGDSSPRILIPTLPAGATATVVFDVVALTDAAAVKIVSSQSTATGANFEDTPSDDPDTPQKNDPTTTPVGGPSVPTLGSIGLLVLASGLGFAALLAIRRRRAVA